MRAKLRLCAGRRRDVAGSCDAARATRCRRCRVKRRCHEKWHGVTVLEHDKLYVEPVEPDSPVVIGACSLLGLISGRVARVNLGEEDQVSHWYQG